jgi:hypothetical protein
MNRLICVKEDCYAIPKLNVLLFYYNILVIPPTFLNANIKSNSDGGFPAGSN